MKTPPNTLSFEQVALEFSDAGCTLLETEYQNSKVPLRFVCQCGDEGSKSLSKFRLKKACKKCGYKDTGKKNGRLSFESVAAEFRNAGHTLLATEYQNNETKLLYTCKCGASYEMSFAGLKRGSLCPSCLGKKVWNFENVKDYYAEQGCTLLAIEYINMNLDMPYLCSCGCESKTSFGNFYHRNVRCFACGLRKNAGENAHQYKPSKTDEERETQRAFPAYTEWRKAVYARDDHTCQICQQKGGKLNAHHLDNYADHKELRTVLDNGITLCQPCHKKFHGIYGNRTVTTRAHFTEFMENHIA